MGNCCPDLWKIYHRKIVLSYGNKTTTNTDIMDFFGQIPKEHMAKLQEIYKFDFEFFGYAKDIPIFM